MAPIPGAGQRGGVGGESRKEQVDGELLMNETQRRDLRPNTTDNGGRGWRKRTAGVKHGQERGRAIKCGASKRPWFPHQEEARLCPGEECQKGKWDEGDAGVSGCRWRSPALAALVRQQGLMEAVEQFSAHVASARSGKLQGPRGEAPARRGCHSPGLGGGTRRAVATDRRIDAETRPSEGACNHFGRDR